ncbi:MAG: hypothetical protein WD895_01265 [Acidimicrobiia bacterium]
MRRQLSAVVTATLLVLGIAGPVVAQEGSIGIVDTATGEWYLRDPGNGATTRFFYGDPGDLLCELDAAAICRYLDRPQG